ncbi:MAG: hypothetical protein LAN63_04950 [Acidobacteriia bacterium]|nr:hypothetical protein [Terriglobia bacterium]
MRKLKMKRSKKPSLTLLRSRQWDKKKMAYILVADKSYKPASGLRSRVIYIGTTAKGAGRPAASAVNKASQVFYRDRGVKVIEVFIVTCQGRQATPTWKLLEAALIHTFWNIHHQIPKYNKKKPAHVDGVFGQLALEKIIRSLPT